MADNQNKLSRFWHELKRRKVVGVIIVYATVAFILMQLAQLFESSLNLPPWFDTVITIALIIGFPIAIIFSWIFDVSSKGITKTEDEPEKDSTSKIDKTVPEKSIIVLPFENISSDPEQEYFSDGLTEEIITDLSYINDLLVISRSSAMTFKGTKQTIKEIAGKVNVRYVLEGSVRKSGNDLRIVAQLIDSSNDSHTWAEKYSGKLDDIFDIQEKVSREIADALKVKLNPEEDKELAKHSIQNIQAYESFLKARSEIWRFSEEGLERALNHLDNGINLIGDNELLLAAKGMVYWQYLNAGINTDKKLLQEIHKIIQKVFALNPDFAQGYFLRGVYNYMLQNFHAAVKDLKIAIRLDSNHPDSLLELARIYNSAGKTDAAKHLVKHLLDIDPLNPINHQLPGFIDFMDGKFDKIVEPHYKMYQLDPTNPFACFSYALSLFWNKRLDEAYKIIEILQNENPESLITKIGLFWKYAFEGKKTEALKVMTQDVLEKARSSEIWARVVFNGYAILGEKERTIDWIEIAVNHGFINYPFLNEYDYLIDNIRGEERFKKLMKRVKKEWENFEV